MVYAVTNTNRILQIQTANHSVRELSGAITSIGSVAGNYSSQNGTGVPGSLLHINGIAIPVDTASDAVQIGGLNAPVQSSTPTSIDVQIPWELSLPDLNGSKFPVTFRSETHSVFAPPVVTVAYVNGIFLRQEPSVPLYASPGVIAHQDFRRLVSDADPAVPGEILHIYMTGLGPVSPAIATGQITPVGPLYSVTGPPVCSFYSGDSVKNTIIPAPLLFAGLAPGTLGVYQVDVTMPDTHLAAPSFFRCESYLPKTTVGDMIPLPAMP